MSTALQCTDKSLNFNPEDFVDNTLAKFNQYVPQTKEHLASQIGSFHPMKIHADISGLDWLIKSKPNIYQFIIKKLIPACTKHMHDTYRVPESQYTRVSVRKCAEVNRIPSAVSRTLPVDLILLFTAQAQPNDTFVAWASPCQLHKTTYRPIVGQVNMNPYFLSMDEKLFFDQFATVLHEIYHVLGFSKALYSYFVDSNYRRKPIYKTFKQSSLEIVSPKVVQHAKEHFKCNGIKGVRLENNGGSGSQGSHWEKTVLGNEVMVANQVANPVISKFTLKLMEDSGWYHINWDMAEPFFWGLDNGCGSAAGECKLSGHSCTKKGDEGCFYDYTFQAICSSDTYSDMCSFFTGTDFKKHDCREANSDNNSRNLGEDFGMGSRCFEGRLVSGRYYHGNMCYKAKCIGSSKIQLMVGNNAYECTSDNQKIKPKGFNGYVTCPVIKDFCEQRNLSCKDDCNTNGRCLSEKRCYCYPGYSGPTCKEIGGPGGFSESTPTKPEIPTKPVEAKCLNNCSGSQGNCVKGKCECYYPWGGLDCSTRKCPKDCSGNGTCINGKCYCKSGFSGIACHNIVLSCPNDCNKRGRCYHGKCSCDSQYTGLDCSQKKCPKDCSGRGKCSYGLCVCSTGYTGTDCSHSTQEPKCRNNCYRRGKCVCGYSSCRCRCKRCYYGSACQYKSSSFSCWFSLKEHMQAEGDDDGIPIDIGHIDGDVAGRHEEDKQLEGYHAAADEDQTDAGIPIDIGHIDGNVTGRHEEDKQLEGYHAAAVGVSQEQVDAGIPIEIGHIDGNVAGRHENDTIFDESYNTGVVITEHLSYAGNLVLRVLITMVMFVYAL